jgi:hypothetical protein
MILFDISPSRTPSTLEIVSKFEPAIVFLLIMGAVAIVSFITYKISKRK